jgi:ABC-type branched-subunit amino acid transport system substrate-binding protein
MPDTTVSTQFDSRYAATFGGLPHPLAGLAYDGIAAIGALVAAGNRDALTARALTQPQGFQGTAGIFRLLPDGTNERGLAVAQIQNNQVVIVEPAPRSFARTPF